MNAYTSRYLCKRLVLVYPASRWFGPGLIRKFRFQTPGQPILYVMAVDIHDLAFGRAMPVELEGVILPNATNRRGPCPVGAEGVVRTST